MRKMTYVENICNLFNRVKFDNDATFNIVEIHNDRVKFDINDHEYFFDIDFIEYISMMFDDIECATNSREIAIDKIELIAYDACAQIDSRYVFHVNETYIAIFNDEQFETFEMIFNYHDKLNNKLSLIKS